MSKVRIVVTGLFERKFEVDGVDLTRTLTTVEVILEPGKPPMVRLTIVPDELEIELDADVVRVLDSLDVEKTEDQA